MLTKAFSRNVIAGVTWKNDWFARLGLPYRFGYEPFKPRVVTKFPGLHHEQAAEKSTGAATFDCSSMVSYNSLNICPKYTD